MPPEAPKELTKDDLEEILQSKVESFTSSPLTGPGENFGSLLLLVDAILLPDHRKVSIAAKLVVTKNLMGREAPFRYFMRKEIDMYLRVLPEILAIQQEYKIPKELFLDVMPRCYGARTTRGGGIELPVDVTAVILMENLQLFGYRLVDRIVGLDLKHAEYVVTYLARFQAMFIVFRLKKPEFFKSTVLKTATEIKHGSFPPEMNPEKRFATMLSTTLACVPAVVENSERIKAAIIKSMELRRRNLQPEDREPFGTVVHNDFWTNNVMFSYDENNESIKSLKLLDFQMTSYGSPVTDLIFFLYTSTSLDVTKDDRDRLIKLYHQEFTKWLELFGLDIKPFSYEAFLKEVEVVAPEQFEHIFFVLRVFCMSKSNPPDINNPEAFRKMDTDNTGLGESYFKTLERFVNEFIERKWI